MKMIEIIGIMLFVGFVLGVSIAGVLFNTINQINKTNEYIEKMYGDDKNDKT